MHRLKKHLQNGQGTLEFALVVPVLLLIIFAIFEAGRALYVYQAIATASREAARVGSAASKCVENPPDFLCYGDNGKEYYLACNLIRTEALRFSGPAQTAASDVKIYYLRDGDDPEDVDDVYKDDNACGKLDESEIQTGDRIVVEVRGFFEPARAIPLMSIPPLTFNSTTRRTILKEVEIGLHMPAGTDIASLAEAIRLP